MPIQSTPLGIKRANALPAHLQPSLSRSQLVGTPPPTAPNLNATHSSASLHSPRFLCKDTFRYPLTDEGIRDMRVVRCFKDNTNRINHMHYSTDGRFMVTSSDDDSILVYDCSKGTKVQTVNSKKTHLADTLRYLRTDNKQYIRYFSGHTRRVTAVSAAPTEEMFISCAQDNTVRLWDLNVSNAAAVLQLERGVPVAAFDRESICFAVGVSNTLKLFDVRNYGHGPFWSTKIPTHVEFAHLQFAPNNKYILLSSLGNELYLVDAFTGQLVHTLKGFVNHEQKPLTIRPAFAPGSQYVFSGSADGAVHCWSVKSGELVRKFPGEHPHPVENIGFHPKYYTLASACTEMRWWMPALEDFHNVGGKERKEREPHAAVCLQPPPEPPQSTPTSANVPSTPTAAHFGLFQQGHEEPLKLDQKRPSLHPHPHPAFTSATTSLDHPFHQSLSKEPEFKAKDHKEEKAREDRREREPSEKREKKEEIGKKEEKEVQHLKEERPQKDSKHSPNPIHSQPGKGYDPLNEILKGMNKELGSLGHAPTTTSTTASSAATSKEKEKEGRDRDKEKSSSEREKTPHRAELHTKDKEKDRLDQSSSSWRERSDRDRDRDRERDRERERGDRDRERERGDRERDRDRERERDREHRERDRDRDGHRDRDPYRDSHHRDRDRDRDRRDQKSREKDREYRS